MDEAWFSAQPIADPLAYQCVLYELGSSLHAARTRKGLADAAKKGRHPGRKLGSKGGAVRGIEPELVERVDQLRVEHRLTVSDACAQEGIPINKYYRTKKRGATKPSK